MSKNSKRYPIMFGKLHHLTPFSLSGVQYRKNGSLTALREDGTTSVFYPNERVVLEGQPPQTQPMANLNSDATVKLPESEWGDVAYTVSDLRASGVDQMTQCTIITWGKG